MNLGLLCINRGQCEMRRRTFYGPKSKGLRTCGEQDRRRDESCGEETGTRSYKRPSGWRSLEKSEGVAVAFLVSGNRSTLPKLISRDLPKFRPKRVPRVNHREPRQLRKHGHIRLLRCYGYAFSGNQNGMYECRTPQAQSDSHLSSFCASRIIFSRYSSTLSQMPRPQFKSCPEGTKMWVCFGLS